MSSSARSLPRCEARGWKRVGLLGVERAWERGTNCTTLLQRKPTQPRLRVADERSTGRRRRRVEGGERATRRPHGDPAERRRSILRAGSPRECCFCSESAQAASGRAPRRLDAARSLECGSRPRPPDGVQPSLQPCAFRERRHSSDVLRSRPRTLASRLIAHGLRRRGEEARRAGAIRCGRRVRGPGHAAVLMRGQRARARRMPGCRGFRASRSTDLLVHVIRASRMCAWHSTRIARSPECFGAAA